MTDYIEKNIAYRYRTSVQRNSNQTITVMDTLNKLRVYNENGGHTQQMLNFSAMTFQCYLPCETLDV